MKFIWDQYKTKLIQLDKIRNFELASDQDGISIIIWFNDHETLQIGRFKTEADAIKFLELSLGESQWE